MNSQKWQLVKDIFAEALEEPSAKRIEFLRRTCGADEELYAEVKSLLEANDETEPLIEKNKLNLASKLNAKGKNYDFTKFGHYTIIREIGRGGMGAVFLCERSDGAFEQKAALKIIRQSFADEEIERHFRRERQILASLNHPNIAKLLDGGVSDTGELYLIMEYVEGVPLNIYAAENNLTIEEKLNLFLKICRAVSFAHQNLIVHRDIKPSNILVTKDGEPILLDFGLAKIVDENLDADRTATVFRAFTPSYASPEQIRGKNITTASDVYSLGVVLYELLTGVRPFQFENKSFEEILQTIDAIQPPRPSSVSIRGDVGTAEKMTNTSRRLKGDLDNIVLMTLRKEPEQRYKSVEQLIGDIERFLKDLPVSARPAIVSYRAAKFYRRNKIVVSATLIVILALSAGLVIALWQANEARRERDLATRRFADVRKLSNALISEITPKIENLQGSTEAREAVVKNALEYLDRLAGESSDDAGLQSELAAAYEKIGDLQGNPNKPNLSDFSGAIESYQKANQIRLNLSATDENLTLLAKNYLQLSAVRYVQSDFQGAIENSDESLKIYKNLARRIASPEITDDYLEAQIDNAQIYADNNQYTTAIPLFENILASIGKSERKETRRLTVKAETFYANALSWDERQTEAESVLKKTLVEAEKLLAEFPNNSSIRKQIWRTYLTGAGIYENINNPIAYGLAQKSLESAEIEVAADGADKQAKQNLAKAYSRLGNIAILLDKPSDGLVNLQKSEKISSQLIEDEPKNITYLRDFGRLYIRFGDLYRKLNDLSKALENYEKSVSYFEKVAAFDEKYTLAKRDAAQSLKNVGEIQLMLERKAEARQTFRNALDILTDLKSRNALGEYDRKMIDELQDYLQKI